MIPARRATHASRPASGRRGRQLWIPLSREPVAPLEIVAIVCVVVWLLGLLSGYTGHGFVHGLLAIAAVAIAVRVWQTGRGGPE
jgi:hypothetical protein